MSNFKIGQKVVYVGNDEDYPKKDYHVIKDMRTCGCGENLIDCGYELPPGYLIAECECGNTYFATYWKIESSFRPLSYTSNTNFEIIANFAPTEERADVIVKPETITN